MAQPLIKQLLFGVILILAACSNPKPEEIKVAQTQLPEKIDFNIHIKPLLSDRCFTCHGPDANQRKGELRLDISENAYAQSTGENSQSNYIIRPENLGKSEFFHRIISTDAEYMMPPPESNLTLTVEEKALLTRWIEQGAEYKPHWAFVKPEKAAIPAVKNKDWIENPIDNFIAKKIETADLPFSSKAKKTTLLRRATLDLTGLPPTLEEITDFLKDETPAAFEKVLDRLLASPHYGERMAVEWLDVARYADSHGYQDDGMRTTWPWRDWVIEQYNKNVPYDQFITEQLAGDLLPNPTKDQLLATCFNRNHPQTQEGGVVDEEYRVEYVADRTNTFGKAFMGLTMECARCHDHKYDPVSQKEYYSLFAFFNNNNDTGIVPYNGEASPTVLIPTPEAAEQLAKLKGEMAPLETALAKENYQEDFKNWLEKVGKEPQIESTIRKNLLADFTFEEEKEINANQIWLDKGRPKNRKRTKNTTFAYKNLAKNKLDAKNQGPKDERPKLVEGKFGKALSFTGDAGVRFNRDLDFDRHQPFSVSIWVKLLKEGEEGPIFNNSNGDFEGYRGWLCKLNKDGTLSFQFNHVWPDNAIDFQTKDKLKVGEWTHIALTYNGNSKANGIHFYINGSVPEYVLHTDNLQRSLLHGVKGTNWSNMPFLLGKELRKSIENFEMDELKLHNRQLSEIEVQWLFNQKKKAQITDSQYFEYYLLTGNNRRYNQNLAKITELRKQENLLLTDQLEVMVMQEKKVPRPTFILDRGMYDARMEEVQTNTPAVFPAIPEKQEKNRLTLAKWLTNKAHPLTARVAVNRFWMMCFGKGLVATQEDFGSQGNLPSHPELLDWLAVDFMENDWDIKRLMKQMMLSSTYQQSSIASDLAKETDVENLAYSHFPVYRLSAEMIRDNALAASNILVKKVGGESVYPYQPDGIWEALATRNATKYQQGKGEDLYRRSMYSVWKRSSPPPSMMNFDAPDRYYCVVRRQKTSTPLQSLVLMNDPQFVETSRMLAERMLKEGGKEVKSQINLAFKLLIGRPANDKELSLLQELYDAELVDFQKDRKIVNELLSIGEHRIDQSLNKIELATHTIIASTIMNFDEFVMKR